MFKIQEFKPVLDALVEVSDETIKIGTDSSLSLDFKSKLRDDYACYVFDHSNTKTLSVAIRGEVSFSQKECKLEFCYDKKTKKYEMEVEKESLYRPEMDLMFLNVFEELLKQTKTKVKQDITTYESNIESMYRKVVQIRELKEKRKSSCYIKEFQEL